MWAKRKLRVADGEIENDDRPFRRHFPAGCRMDPQAAIDDGYRGAAIGKHTATHAKVVAAVLDDPRMPVAGVQLITMLLWKIDLLDVRAQLAFDMLDECRTTKS
jgi:hypothetical protein